MRGTRALIVLALRQTVRARGFAAACVLLYACIFGLAYGVATTGPKEGNLKFYVTAAWALLAGYCVVVVGFLPLRFFGSERTERQIHLLGTRPVSRFAFIGARFCASVLVGGAVLACGCLVIRAGTGVLAGRLGIDTDALTGCMVHPAPPREVPEGQVRELAAALARDEEFLRRHGEEGVAAIARENLSVWRLKDGETARITWRGLRRCEAPVRVRVNARIFPPWEVITVQFGMGGETFARELQSGVPIEFSVAGTAIDAEGACSVAVAVPEGKELLVYFPQADGLALYLPEVGFGGNLARAGLLFFAFLAAIGGFSVLAGASLSHAVGVLAVAVLVFVALGAGMLTEAAQQFTGTLEHSHGRAAPEPVPLALREAWQTVLLGMLAVVPVMHDVDPGTELTEGRTIALGAAGATAFYGAGLRGGGALLLAWLLFRRRELGRRV